MVLVFNACCGTQQHYSDTGLTEFKITVISQVDTSCVRERGRLRRQMKNLGSELQVSLITTSFDIRINDASRTKADNYSGVGEDGERYDIIIGRPHRHDPIIAFLKSEKEWIIIDFKCNSL